MKIIYGTPACSKCQALKRELEEKKEQFKYINIASFPDYLINKLIEKYNTTMLPIVGEEDVDIEY